MMHFQRNIRHALWLVLWAPGAVAQNSTTPPTPVEVMQGNKNFYSLLLVNRPFAPEKTLGFFNVTTYTADNQNEIARNEFFSTSLVSVPLYRNIRVASGINLNSAVGLNYFSGFQYSKVWGPWLMVLVPGLYFREQSSIETLALIEFGPPISQHLKLYTRIHGMYNTNPNGWKHNRSYNYMRLGLTVKRISLGLGLNTDWYGTSRVQEKNYGIFIRAELP